MNIPMKVSSSDLPFSESDVGPFSENVFIELKHALSEDLEKHFETSFFYDFTSFFFNFYDMYELSWSKKNIDIYGNFLVTGHNWINDVLLFSGSSFEVFLNKHKILLNDKNLGLTVSIHYKIVEKNKIQYTSFTFRSFEKIFYEGIYLDSSIYNGRKEGCDVDVFYYLNKIENMCRKIKPYILKICENNIFSE